MINAMQREQTEIVLHILALCVRADNLSKFAPGNRKLQENRAIRDYSEIHRRATKAFRRSAPSKVVMKCVT